MPEVQTSTESGEMTQRFIEFVMMHSQNAALFLGQIPNPHTNKPEVNLDVAKLFIDQLVMIRQKTKGNLNNDELAVLNNAISSLQMAFVEASRGAGASVPAAEPQKPQTAEAAPTDTEPKPEAGEQKPEESSEQSEETKKRFTKSYG